ncbi:MAG: glycosyltransferase [Planctomycetota bacterium]|nr:MAG: glycosyltransferase [Planctomycetota bacterium]
MPEPNVPNPAFSLVVFSDDWGRHPSSCQHLIRRFLGRYPVLWVNTIGMREPRLDRVTFRRGIEKLRGWFFARRHPPSDDRSEPAPEIVDPRMWPFFRRAFDRRMNRRLLLRQLTPRVESLASPRIALTTIPIVADLVGRLPVDAWVYYCVDNFSEWPEMHGPTIEMLERRLIERVDVIVAAGERLAERIAKRGRNAVLLPHGVDYAMWQAASTRPAEDPLLSCLKDLPRPLVVFWGSVNWQVDDETVAATARAAAPGTVVLIGPVSDCSPKLRQLENVVSTGAVPYESLPQAAGAADVLIMPYRRHQAVVDAAPLKLLEYLSTDKPVVVCDVPAHRAWADALDIAESPEQFASLVKTRLETGLPSAQREARRRVADESWDNRAAVLERELAALASRFTLNASPDARPGGDS